MDNCREDTVVNEVIRLKREILLSCDRRFLNWVKIVSFISPLIDDLIHANMVLEF